MTRAKLKKELVESIQSFKLPTYREIPDVGLYLDQTTQYISEYLAPLEDIVLTGSMISNYVKKGLIANPVKKQYSRDQIAYLIFIAIAKSVLSLEDLRLFIELQKNSYPAEIAYEYFRAEFENILFYIFGVKDQVDVVGVDDTEEKHMLRATIITVAHKIVLDKCFSRLHQTGFIEK